MTNHDKCKIHINIDRCKCKKRTYDKSCINKLCEDCCENTICSEHYGKCAFCDNYRTLKGSDQVGRFGNTKSCSTDACSGKCCPDRYCEYHFDVFENITQKDINDFKKILRSGKPSLPADIINIIVDEYVDNRRECYVCNKKISDFENAYEEYEILACDRCHNWCCGENYNCIKFKENNNNGWWNRDIKICKKCYTKDDDTVVSDDTIESDDIRYMKYIPRIRK